jgi:hypothetical protein
MIMENISLIIKEYCKLSNVSLYSLASMLNLKPATLYRSLNSPSLTIARLHQISTALNHNFFIHFVQNTATTEEQLLKLSTENRELSSKLASLQKEVDLLREINSLLKAKHET